MPKKKIPNFKKTSEASLQKTILKFLRNIPNSWWIKFPAGKWSVAGVPDILGCYHGHFFAFEVKTATGKPTALQLKTIEWINKAGGTASIIRSKEDAKNAINHFRPRTCL